MVSRPMSELKQPFGIQQHVVGYRLESGWERVLFEQTLAQGGSPRQERAINAVGALDTQHVE